jgi:Putative phage serine protease XkdF
MKNEYPIYEIQLKDGELELGLSAVALVDKPAYESSFIALSKTIDCNFEVNDIEKRIITGALMIPDKLVYREEKGIKFYVTATKETIFEASQKFAKENKNNSIKLTHQANGLTSDVFIFESFITDSDRVTGVKGFENLPLGTWFITCKVLNDEIWNNIKDGKFNGFSLEALFEMRSITTLNDSDIKQILESLK